MYNLDNIVRIYFSCVSIQSILDETIEYCDFPEREFRPLLRNYMLQYSDTEAGKLYDYIRSSSGIEGHPYAGLDRRSGLNVFAALEQLSEQLLTMKENEVVCQYPRLLRFREVTKYVEEDLLVCAFLAIRNKRIGEKHVHFTWNTTIGHNNTQLNRIMAKGISENHFHLYGSAPAFHLIWIYFMNHIGNSISWKEVEDRFDTQRMTREHYKLNYAEDSVSVRILKAALIRVFLVSKLIGWETSVGLSLKRVKECLTRERDIKELVLDIQAMIDDIVEYSIFKGKDILADYALYGVKELAAQGETQKFFAGERWFMYRMLESELSKDRYSNLYYKWFYAYLAIKASIRSESVQVNETIGFENFSVYNQRKNFYKNKSNLIQCAVYGSMAPGNIRSLEVRITPADSAEENAGLIKCIDDVLESGKGNPIPKSNYYYVFHFIKEKDELVAEGDLEERFCRHYTLRRKLEKTANAVCNFRKAYPELANRVKGIDACSQEIECRPEVFASIFRFLTDHVQDDIFTGKISQLRMTYHVGEDFLDIVDGLRAVDEAVKFLNMQCGDRIGHGTVLGLDVREWYSIKQNTIVISQQDYLDNLIWLYHKLTEYHLEGFDNLKDWIVQNYDVYFSRIYQSGIIKDALYSQKDSSLGGTMRTVLNFDIHTYYDSWKIRGDEPELYLEKKRFSKGIAYYQRDFLVNNRYPENFAIRKRKEVGLLYYLYHYSLKVREVGQKTVEIYLPPAYIDGVEAVQKAMQKEFSTFGIGIETNPSSNFSISTIQKYEEHPIVQFYNKDLCSDAEMVRECPQINVSINTDDKGVFHTSLENEYALMACAMEKAKDEKGNLLYNRQMIYEWLDNIRKMGNLQTFNDYAEQKDVGERYF